MRSPISRDLGGGRFRVAARMPVDELGDLFGIELDDDDVDSVGGLLTKAVGRLPLAGSPGAISGLVLTAERTEGRRKRLSTVLVERDQPLIDAQAAFDDDATNEQPRDRYDRTFPRRLRQLRRSPQRREIDPDQCARR